LGEKFLIYFSCGVPSYTSFLDACRLVSLVPWMDVFGPLVFWWCGVLLAGEKIFICLSLGVPSLTSVLDTIGWASLKLSVVGDVFLGSLWCSNYFHYLLGLG